MLSSASSVGPHSSTAPTSRHFLWAAAAVIVATVVAYVNVLTGPLVLDDTGTIAENASLRHLATAWHPPGNGIPVSGRPVANLSFALNYAISGTDTWSYHIVNLAIHVLAALTLLGIVRRTLGPRFGADASLVAASAIALLWAVHPLQTSAVAYLSQRVESLMGLFYLLTLYAFIRGAYQETGVRGQVTENNRRKIIDGRSTDPRSQLSLVSRLLSPVSWFALSFLACLLGMATKEVMVTAPVMVFLYDRTFLGAGAWKARWRYYLALASTWLVVAVLVARTGTRGGTAGFGSSVPWWAYAFSQVYAVAHYLRLAVWPQPLIADYGRILGGPPFEFVVDLILLASLAVASLILLWRRSAWGFLGAWFFVVLAPSSSIVPIATEITAEHRMYLPLAAVLSAAVCGVVVLMVRSPARSRRTGAVLIGIVVILALVTATAARNRVYRSLLAFWTDAAAKVPDNAGAWNNLGNVLAEQGRLAEAEANFRAAIRLAPDYSTAQFNLGNTLVREDRLDDALAAYRAAFRLHPQDSDLRHAFGLSAFRLGNKFVDVNRTAAAAEMFAVAAELEPGLVDGHINYGNVLAQLGRNADAMREFQAALALDPNSADVHNNLGGLLAQSGRLTDARAQFEEALRLKPDYREARANLNRVQQMEASGQGHE